MIIKVGQTITYRPGFGHDAPRRAKILAVERCSDGDKYGVKVEELDLSCNEGVVDLDDAHWAYTDQIDG